MATSLVDLLAGSSTPEKIIVQSGDTLSKIAERTGVSVEDLVRINKIANPNLIGVGQELSTGNELKAAGLASGLIESVGNAYDKAASYVNPLKALLRFTLGGEKSITRDDFSKEGVELLKELAREGGAGSYSQYHKRGGGTMGGLVTGEKESSNRAANEVAYILGRFGTEEDELGNVRIIDKYDFDDKEKNLRIAKQRSEAGAGAAAMLSKISAYAPSIRNAIRSILGKDESSSIPVDITFSREELRR